MRWKLRHQDSHRPGESLVNETEQFLSGGYLEFAFASGRSIPAWAWLASVVHGDESALIRAQCFVRDHHGTRPEYDCWGRVLQLLARLVLDSARAMGCSVSEIQRELLIPLELAVMLTPVGPATMCRLVEAMLVDAGPR